MVECLEIKKKIVVLDLETTGFSPFSEEITEVGFVTLDGGTLEVMGMFDSLIDIKGKIPQKVASITNINNEMTKKFGLPKEVVGTYLREALKDAIVVAHNASFDFSFLAHHFDVEPDYFYDTLSLSRIAFPDEKKHDLKTVCQRFSVPLDGHHRALNDAMATAVILKVLLKDYNTWKNINTLHGGGRGIKYKPTHTKVVM